MKKIIILVAVAIFLSAATTAHAQTTTVKNKTAKAFLDMLDDSEETATAAINKFSNEAVVKNGMIPFGKNPTIVKETKNCVYFVLQHDGEKNAYNICTEGDKIISFDWTTED